MRIIRLEVWFGGIVSADTLNERESIPVVGIGELGVVGWDFRQNGFRYYHAISRRAEEQQNRRLGLLHIVPWMSKVWQQSKRYLW